MAEDLSVVTKLFEHGVVSAVLAYGWWQAERRATAAQELADKRADKMTSMIEIQVTTNEKVTTAIAVQHSILERLGAWIDLHGAGRPPP